MKLTGTAVLVIWGAALCAVCLLGVFVFDLAALPAALLGAAGVAVLVTALAQAAVPQKAGDPDCSPPADEVGESLGIAVIALGLTIALVGLVAMGGPILAGGLAIAAIGVFALTRELSATKRSRRRQ